MFLMEGPDMKVITQEDMNKTVNTVRIIKDQVSQDIVKDGQMINGIKEIMFIKNSITSIPRLFFKDIITEGRRKRKRREVQ